MKTSILETAFGKIACHQSSGSGASALLVHGNSASARAFAHQLDGPLGEKHRLIAIDLPGHGQSSNATDPAVYTLPGFAHLLIDVARQLDFSDAVFAGWSLGGHIVLEAAPDLPGAKGFMIFGTPPLGFPPAMDRAFLPHPAMAFSFTETIDADQAREYAAAGFRPNAADLPPSFSEDILRTDGRSRANLGASIGPGSFRDEVEVVAHLKQPLAILHGADEQLINGSYFASLKTPTLWRGAVQSIAGAGHTPHWEQPAAFDALLGAFIEDCQ